MKRIQVVVWGLVALLASAPAAPLDSAPLLDQGEAKSVHAEDWRGLGPFLERRTSADGQQLQRALPRPLYTEWQEPAEGWVYRDFLWPLGFSRHRRDGGVEFFALFLHTTPDQVAEKNPERWWLLPVFFYGRDRQGQSYAGVFPLWGQVCNLVGYESVQFRCFPAYLETQKKDVHSQSWVWPIINRTDGDRVKKRRVFPFWGNARNAHDERRLILWPFWHTITQFPDEQGKQGEGWLFLPFYGRYRQTDAAGTELNRSWTCVWPFFSGETGKDHSRLYSPWPFFRRETRMTSSGPVARFHVWPFYGTEEKPGRGGKYLGWPFWQTGHTVAGKTETDSRVLLPIYWAVEQREAGVPTRRFREIWPLWRRESTATASRDTVLSLWPARRTEPIERNYAPFWTLYTRERSGDDRVSHELLWGLGKMSWKAPGPFQTSLFPVFDWRSNWDGYDFSLGKGLVRVGHDSFGHYGTVLWFLDW